MTFRPFACALLLGAIGVANAQSTPAPQQPTTAPATDRQQAAARKQNQVLAKYAESIVAMIDRGHAGPVWDQASEIAKQSVSRTAFIQATKADRGQLGKVVSRKLARITHVQSKGGQLPAGQYINVNFSTTFGKHTTPVRELVSFHLDGDRKWRLSGYTVRQPGVGG